MPAQNPQFPARSRRIKERQSRVLLVSRAGGIENDGAFAALGRPRLHAQSLLEALERLKPEGVDIVLLDSEFGEEERTLFLLEAQRRSFAGPVLQVVSAAAFALKSAPPHEPKREGEHSVSPLFTEREQAVLERVSGGWTNRQIAQALNCSEGSVKAILQQIFGKLGVRKRAQIVRLAFERGLSVSTVETHRAMRR